MWAPRSWTVAESAVRDSDISRNVTEIPASSRGSTHCRSSARPDRKAACVMRKTLLAVITLVAIAGWAGSSGAQEAPDGGSGSVKPFQRTTDSNGSFTDSIAIAVPAFHGLEPQLALTYDSSRGNGFVGVGWKVDGLSVIERARPHGGAPLFDDTKDVFTTPAG